MILGGRVGEETTVTSDEHDTPVGEMTTTHPEHAASGSKQRTVVATAFMTPSGLIDLLPEGPRVKVMGPT
jgi:hypothetical protein